MPVRALFTEIDEINDIIYVKYAVEIHYGWFYLVTFKIAEKQ